MFQAKAIRLLLNCENMKTQITYYYLVKNNQIVFRGFNLNLMKKELESKIELSLYSHNIKLTVCTNLSESDLSKMVKIG